ncbi:hypothetical protein C8F04DRAFT_960204 [Mycena alexandri]|uniref:F-box domain-containing protein n=1 Tax=Mycena alexandri TaxID=1745969 RepID=A0AAD6X006_9AGAR|nr:hypothetical protein C8F04DRAFT_960204 [Mycena alexandri]
MTSRFASKLGTNFCPLDEEVLEIQRLLVVPLSRLKDIDHEIAELQKAIDELAEERDSVSAYVEAHKALLSPLRRLPLDIMQEIFVACLPTHRNCVMSAVEAPVLLGRICSSWRTVSLSTPRLWARLHIAEPERPRQAPIYQEKYAQRLAITKAWLERSGRCPLSISLHGSDLHRPGVSDTVNRFLDLVLSYASRWQHISVTASSSALDTVFNLTEHDVPMLKTLEMRENNQQDVPMLKTLEIHQHLMANSDLKSFGVLRGPKISSVTLTGNNGDLLHLPLRWESLTHLSITGHWHQWDQPAPALDINAALWMFSHCPSLRACQLLISEGNNPLPPQESRHSIIDLPSLLSLDIICLSELVFESGLFTRLSLPELRSFKFSSNSSNYFQEVAFPFLLTSSHLESLDMEVQMFSPQSLVDLLHTVPSTIQLRLHGRFDGRPDPLNDDVLIALTPSSDRPSLGCPILQELHITCCMNVSGEALHRFIVARMTAQATTLRCVNIQFGRAKELDIQSEIQPFLDAGLEVSTRYNETRSIEFSPWRGLLDAPDV